MSRRPTIHRIAIAYLTSDALSVTVPSFSQRHVMCSRELPPKIERVRTKSDRGASTSDASQGDKIGEAGWI